MSPQRARAPAPRADPKHTRSNGLGRWSVDCSDVHPWRNTMDRRSAREMSHGQRHVLVLGAEALARRTAEALSTAGRCTIGVAALAPDATEQNVAKIAVRHAVDEVYIA